MYQGVQMMRMYNRIMDQMDNNRNPTHRKIMQNVYIDYFQQLLPRQSPIYVSPRKDLPINYESKPFVYKRINRQQKQQQTNHHQQPIQNIEKIEDNSFLQQSIRQTSKKFNTSKTFQQMAMKHVQSQHDIQFPFNQDQKPKQRQFQQDNISFVSISTQKKSETSKSNSEVGKEIDYLQQVNDKQRKRQHLNIQIETTKIVTLQEESSQPNSNPIISVNQQQEGQQNEMQQVVKKYHFQTQKILNQQINQPIDSINEGFSPSLKLIKVSPDQKMQSQQNHNITFSPKQQLSSKKDAYIKYKKSAENSPIIDSSKKQYELQKEIHMKKRNTNQNNRDLTYTFANTNFQINHFNQQDDQYGEKLAKSMQQIDILKKQLLKSTQNNINALFASNISSEQCQVVEMVDKINKKVGQVCQKVQDIERKRIIEMEKQLERRRILSYERRQRQTERQEYKMDKQRENQRQRQSRRIYEGKSDNMVLDLGRGSSNEGKIIAIYPHNKMINVKDLMFGQNQIYNNSQVSDQKETLRMMQQMQQTFISALKTFQTSVDQSLKLKLQQMKKAYQKNQQAKKQEAERLQKLQRVSQQTNDRQNEQYDDSRGSINVMYIRKLRQLEQEIREKQWKIQRLQKENYYMEKQLEKMQQVSFVKKGKQSRFDVVSPLKYKQDGLTFNYNKSRKASHEVNYGQSPVSPLQTYHNDQDHNINFSFSPKLPHYQHQNYPSPSSSQGHQQRINEPAAMTNQEMQNFYSQNAPSQKKSTHSFHHYQSKTIQSKQIIEMKQKLSQFQLLIKQKDIRIKQLENTIMDYLESSRKWKKDIQQQSQRSNSSRISGYSSVNTKQENTEILHIKINNLKTLLKQSKNQMQNYKRLYEAQKASNTTTPSSNQHIRHENVKDDMKSNTTTSRSICVSDKMTHKNQKYLINGHMGQSPFVEITQTQITGQKNRQVSYYGKQTIFQSLINENGVVSMMTGILVNFIMMSWSLKEVITKLCGNQVNVDKINRNARQFLSELKVKDQNVWKKVWLKLDEGQFDSRIKEIWSE